MPKAPSSTGKWQRPAGPAQPRAVPQANRQMQRSEERGRAPIGGIHFRKSRNRHSIVGLRLNTSRHERRAAHRTRIILPQRGIGRRLAGRVRSVAPPVEGVGKVEYVTLNAVKDLSVYLVYSVLDASFTLSMTFVFAAADFFDTRRPCGFDRGISPHYPIEGGTGSGHRGDLYGSTNTRCG
jgi:hypothetical protein